MSFERFMDLALYTPELGYYAKTPPIGRTGDFYTSVSVGPLFGRLLARQFFQMWRLLGEPDAFSILEQGAHDGQLARDILEWCRAEAPEFAARLRYAVVDSPPVAGTVGLTLRQLIAEQPTGVYFSNELFDADSVRVITYRQGAWQERCVVVEGEQFAWTDRPIIDEALNQAIAERDLLGIEGYTTEISLRGFPRMHAVARGMGRGYVLTIDYGFPAAHYYAPHRASGTLRAYARHQLVDDVLRAPGTQDLTAHVDFTALARAGERGGLITLGFVDQHHFLMGIAHDELAGAGGPVAGVAAQPRAFQTLIHPEHLGTRFFALVQAKDTPGGLDGLRFARATDLP